MIIFFFIVTSLVTLLSLYLLIEGIVKKVMSCRRVGGIMLLASMFVILCYFMHWTVPLILIFGITGFVITSIGTYGENDTEQFIMSLVFCIIGSIFYILSSYFWYQSGWYTSLAFVTFVLCCWSFINSMQKKRIPILSLLMSIFYMVIAAYVWMTREVNVPLVCIGGGLLSLILKAGWKRIYEKDF